jgi:phage FluMu protein Com
MPTAKKCNDGWIRCGKCNHKLGRMKGVWPEMQAMPAIEIKCHSCKTLNYILIGGQKKE